jgi:hypothetical protein
VDAIFFVPVQNGSGTNPASYTMGIESFPGVKWPGLGVVNPLLRSAEVKERVELYFYSPSGLLWPVLGQILPLPLPLHDKRNCILYIFKRRAVSSVGIASR